MAKRPVGLFSAPPMAPIQAAQAQMTPAQALATFSAFRKEADPQVARRRAMAQTMTDYSGPTTSGSVAEGLIRMAQAAMAARSNRDTAMEDMQTKADAYNTKQSEFDAGVAEKAQKAGEIGAEAGRYGVYGMNKPQPMEVGGRVVDAANNYRELYAPKQEMTDYQRESLELRRDLAASRGGNDGGPQWRPATQDEQSAYGTTQPLLIDDRTGNVKPIPGAGGVMASADQRGRVALSLPNVVQAQQDLAALEGKDGRNIFNEQWGARFAEAVPWDGGTIARTMGGPEYQAYEQASRTFEAAIMPIFSGSAVTESEAQRFVRANLPRMGDTPETLAKKSLNRQRIVNGAAELAGQPLPFPAAGSWRATSQIAGATPQANQNTETPEQRRDRLKAQYGLE